MKKTLLIIGIIFAFVFGIMIFMYIAEPVSKTTTDDLQSAPSISARHAVLIDGKSGEVLYQKDAETKAYPASTTKIMTALTVLDICKQYDIDLQTKLTIPKEAVGVEGSSIYLKAGDKKTVEDLLYGLMLRSGNDAATALAICLGGNLENFVSQMNDTAKSLGCTGTNFVNPSGLFDENHYTTAADLAAISRKAMENDTFRQIVASKSWQTYYNKNKTVSQYQGGTGIKIGFTEKSGRTLVASATRDDVDLICVVLNDGNWFDDAYALMDYGFALKGVDKDEPMH